MAYDSQRTPALPWQIVQSRALNQPCASARLLVADCNAVSVKRPKHVSPWHGGRLRWGFSRPGMGRPNFLKTTPCKVGSRGKAYCLRIVDEPRLLAHGPSLSQSDAGATAVLVDELDAGAFNVFFSAPKVFAGVLLA
jgi:hypothetical protein